MSRTAFDRRGFLRTAAAGTALASLPAALPAPAAAAPAAAPTRKRTATFRWLGTTGWRIDVAGRTVLIDPYVSRFPTGLFGGTFNPATPLAVDPGAIAAADLGDPETVLVTHTHWDHFADVPYLARTTGARVLGTLTAYHLGLAAGVPGAQLSPVKGGEVLDFGDYHIEVVAALHSRNAGYSLAFPGVRVQVPAAPATIADLPEGDTLAYVFHVPGGPSVFLMGASDFVERNLTGIRPDVAMIPINSGNATLDYVPRLLAALDHPAVVVPVHWDNFETPLKNPPVVAPADRDRLDAFLAAIRAASPHTRILRPEFRTPYRF
ncbi:MBL fold metallo-hydrolase [Couchioplanes caeruleus]|uniref:MBL fold metallo-hydrolase n=2 Tax=Couchioplanes caeruleus TaxID=56438 RepID=A0A1K0FBI7_9ACTN|nr:MBL fold metallo-hydrolase [Couchioplanes caeruleus]OJF10205.1 MBL fold metallo-hydrolase [Couchioplanes caeruleus subsp. caeruleus]ROP28831.1 L-ascorbate metabolism protein UlaG (beta-lactamase superfamily) [Couchioplanes caeruleus]